MAISCVKPNGVVLYEKTITRKDVLATVRFEYPKAESAFWDPIVRRTAASLKLTQVQYETSQ